MKKKLLKDITPSSISEISANKFKTFELYIYKPTDYIY